MLSVFSCSIFFLARVVLTGLANSIMVAIQTPFSCPRLTYIIAPVNNLKKRTVDMFCIARELVQPQPKHHFLAQVLVLPKFFVWFTSITNQRDLGNVLYQFFNNNLNFRYNLLGKNCKLTIITECLLSSDYLSNFESLLLGFVCSFVALLKFPFLLL